MEVYIEYAIIDNLIMDFLLLKAAARLNKTRQEFYLLAIGALIGCLVAVVVPIFSISDGLSFLIKIVLAALICLCAAKHKTVFSYLKFLNYFVLLTFAVGGAVIGTLTLLGIEYTVEGISKMGVFPIGLNLLIGYLFYLLIKKITEGVIEKLSGNFYCECELTTGGVTTNLKGYIDSGNLLKDVKTGLPIVVCNKTVADGILSVHKQPDRYMPISTAGGFGLLALYEIDGIKVKTQKGENFSDAILGVSSETQKLLGGADILIGASLI